MRLIVMKLHGRQMFRKKMIWTHAVAKRLRERLIRLLS